jgi:hypothetical protein
VLADHKVLKDLREMKALLDHKVLRDPRAIQVLADHKVLRAIPVQRVFKEFPARQV